jgi:tripartite-type tricarboxylate transporter receptor subunit TctC
VPTAIEQGVPNMVGQLFLGIYAPAATPKNAIDALSEATKKATDNPEFEKILTTAGFDAAPYYTADASRKYMAEEFERWKPVVEAIGLKTN